MPLMVTSVPAGPLAGVKLSSDSVGVNIEELAPVPAAFETETMALGAPLGTTTVSDVGELKTADDAARDPNLTWAPGTKFVPVSVTMLPVTPEAGVNEVTVGAPEAKRSALEAALVPPGVVRVTSTTPRGSSGAKRVAA